MLKTPLILDFKLIRKESTLQVNYVYDPQESLNIIYIDGLKRPFIDMEASDVELLTKTKVHREQDDDNLLFDLTTKTRMAREQDDHHSSLIEMATKTFTVRERDDENFINHQ